jgi:hypothetical protein
MDATSLGNQQLPHKACTAPVLGAWGNLYHATVGSLFNALTVYLGIEVSNTFTSLSTRLLRVGGCLCNTDSWHHCTASVLPLCATCIPLAPACLLPAGGCLCNTDSWHYLTASVLPVEAASKCSMHSTGPCMSAACRLVCL